MSDKQETLMEVDDGQSKSKNCEVKPRERKSRRAEVQIYRPGALRLKKEATKIEQSTDKHETTAKANTRLPPPPDPKKDTAQPVLESLQTKSKLSENAKIKTDVSQSHSIGHQSKQTNKSTVYKPQAKELPRNKPQIIEKLKSDKEAHSKFPPREQHKRPIEKGSQPKTNSVQKQTNQIHSSDVAPKESPNIRVPSPTDRQIGKSYSRIRSTRGSLTKDTLDEAQFTNSECLSDQSSNTESNSMQVKCLEPKKNPPITKESKESSKKALKPSEMAPKTCHDSIVVYNSSKAERRQDTTKDVLPSLESVKKSFDRFSLVNPNSASDSNKWTTREMPRQNGLKDRTKSSVRVPSTMSRSLSWSTDEDHVKRISKPKRGSNKSSILKKDSKLVYSTTESDDEASPRDDPNPMKYVELRHRNKKKTLTSTTGVRWADEKHGDPRQKPRDEAQYPRGIIHLTPNNCTQDNPETVTETKALFNPNNPSKPMLVPSTGRALPTASDSQFSLSSKTAKTVLPVPSTDMPVDPSLLYSIQKGEMDINYYVSSNQIPMEFKRIMDIRQHLKDCYRRLLQSDLHLCQDKNIEAALWKSLYYTIIEKLREYISSSHSLKDTSLGTLHMLVEDGQEYLQQLVTCLQEAHGFSLEAHMADDLTSKPATKNKVRIAISLCQRFLLSLGDLARYKDQYSTNPNFNIARKWYIMAQDVLPRNGRPFNQLAIIAVNLKRPLDVVYYYVRSLTASNPFHSARDSLVSMFEDLRKKYEMLEKNSRDHNPKKNADMDRYSNNSGNCRQEIWIRPDSGATNKRTLSESEPEDVKRRKLIELSKLSPEQLMKQFLTYYLHCHGMLFSKVGLEDFHQVLRKMLDAFRAVLKSVPSRLSSVHLLQIIAINIFAIDNTQLKDSREVENGYRSAAQDLALVLAQDMFGHLCEAAVAFLPSSLNYPLSDDTVSKGPAPTGPDSLSPDSASDSDRLFLPQVATFMPAIKVWCDWLLYNSSVWNPPAVSSDLPAGSCDAWNMVAELATLVKGIGTPDVPLYDEGPDPSLCLVVLPEDRYLRGYSPLLGSQSEQVYASATSHIGRVEDWCRLGKMTLCLTQFLCGVEPPVLRLQKTDHGQILVAVVSTPTPDLDHAPIPTETDPVDDEMPDEELVTEEVDLLDIEIPNGDSGIAQNMIELIKRKRQLEKDLREQKKAMAIAEGPITSQIEIRPQKLVPDTNCFISHLPLMQTLITNSPYDVMVPLAVMDELSKMGKELAIEKFGGNAAHALMVREAAAASFDYLTGTLKKGNKSLKCITSQGSILTTAYFSYEVNDDDMTNDDRILSCCVHSCTDNNRIRPISEGVRRIFRDVVLLTDDRILRLKAYAVDVPVRTLIDFAKWAGVAVG